MYHTTPWVIWKLQESEDMPISLRIAVYGMEEEVKPMLERNHFDYYQSNAEKKTKEDSPQPEFEEGIPKESRRRIKAEDEDHDRHLAEADISTLNGASLGSNGNWYASCTGKSADFPKQLRAREG